MVSLPSSVTVTLRGCSGLASMMAVRAPSFAWNGLIAMNVMPASPIWWGSSAGFVVTNLYDFAFPPSKSLPLLPVRSASISAARSSIRALLTRDSVGVGLA